MTNWKRIPDHPRYDASDDGRVRRRYTGAVLNPWHDDRGGYPCVKVDGTTKRVHRLVLEAHVGPCPEGHQCRHLDDDPANNALSNLRWGPPEKNVADRRRNGGYPAALHELDVAIILAMREDGMSYRAIAAEFGVAHSTVHAAVAAAE